MELIALMTFVFHSLLWAEQLPSLHTHEAASTELQIYCDDFSKTIDTRFGNVDLPLWQNLLKNMRGEYSVEFFFDNWSEEKFVLTKVFCNQSDTGAAQFSASFETSSVGTGSIMVLIDDTEVRVIIFLLHDLLAPIE